MGFSKKSYSPVIEIEVLHPYYPGEVFIFTFPKVLPQSALDAEKSYLGLPDTEQPEALRKGLIGVVAEMVTLPPTGFDDFPDLNPGELQTGSTKVALRRAVLDYFDDPEKPELEQIISGAWRAYKTAAIPAAYLKSVSGNGSGDRHAASVSQSAKSTT